LEVPRMNELALEDQVPLLRRHSLNLAGYAFALARRQGIGPEEAARLWMEPRMHSSTDNGIEVEAWLERNAAGMALFHGGAYLTRAEGGWTMRVEVGAELAPLQTWEAVDYWVRWMAEQAQILAMPRGLRATAGLEGTILAVRFERLVGDDGG
jgi:hypothetical protein